jgi:hypothetical protein
MGVGGVLRDRRNIFGNLKPDRIEDASRPIKRFFQTRPQPKSNKPLMAARPSAAQKQSVL